MMHRIYNLNKDWRLTRPLDFQVTYGDKVEVFHSLPVSIKGPRPEISVLAGYGNGLENATEDFIVHLIEHYERLRKKEEEELTCSENLQKSYLEGLLERV